MVDPARRDAVLALVWCVSGAALIAVPHELGWTGAPARVAQAVGWLMQLALLLIGTPLLVRRAARRETAVQPGAASRAGWSKVDSGLLVVFVLAAGATLWRALA